MWATLSFKQHMLPPLQVGNMVELRSAGRAVLAHFQEGTLFGALHNSTAVSRGAASLI